MELSYDAKKIIAIGDLHGAYFELIKIVQTLNLVDEKLNWIANDTFSNPKKLR